MQSFELNKILEDCKPNSKLYSINLENIKLSKRLILSYGGIVRTNFEKLVRTIPP